MTIEEASIQAMPPIVIRRGCFMSSPFVFSRWFARVSDASPSLPPLRVGMGRPPDGLLLTTSATATGQGPGAQGLEHLGLGRPGATPAESRGEPSRRQHPYVNPSERPDAVRTSGKPAR